MSVTTSVSAARTVSRRDLLRSVGDKARLIEANGIVSIAAHCLAFTGVACRSCEDACLQRAIRFRPQLGGQYHPAIDTTQCTVCGECLDVCPVDALSIYRGGQP